MLRTTAHTLPGAVGLLQPRGGYQKGGAQSAVIKNCLQYISTHLHEELRLEGWRTNVGCAAAAVPQ